MSAAGDATPYVLCEDLFKIYKIADLEVVALRGLDLSVERGELMAVVGASGSGKSTLLNILGGLDVPSAGRAVVGGRDLLKLSPRDLVSYRREAVGFVWQQVSRNLVPYLTAQQNVELPLVLAGWPRRRRRQRAEELLESVEMADSRHQRPMEMSGGEQQRVAIAVALAHNPPMLLADEPTGELDSQGSRHVLEVLGEINRRFGVTIIIVTHDAEIVYSVDRVVTIRDGRTSAEALRGQEGAGLREETGHREFVVLDGVGRLQLPLEHVRRLGLRERVRLSLHEDHVRVYPADHEPGGDDDR